MHLSPPVAKVVVCSKAVTPIVGVCTCSMFCCTLLYVPSSFAIILMGKRDFVFLVSRDCCVALPRGTVGLSAVCDCGIS